MIAFRYNLGNTQRRYNPILWALVYTSCLTVFVRAGEKICFGLKVDYKDIARTFAASAAGVAALILVNKWLGTKFPASLTVVVLAVSLSLGVQLAAALMSMRDFDGQE